MGKMPDGRGPPSNPVTGLHAAVNLSEQHALDRDLVGQCFEDLTNRGDGSTTGLMSATPPRQRRRLGGWPKTGRSAKGHVRVCPLPGDR